VVRIKNLGYEIVSPPRIPHLLYFSPLEMFLPVCFKLIRQFMCLDLGDRNLKLCKERLGLTVFEELKKFMDRKSLMNVKS
jgi:hypothetical protein